MALNIKKMPTDAEIRRMFDAVPILERYKVADQVVRAGSKPIMTRARQIVPEQIGKRELTSEEQDAGFGKPLKTTIKQVVRTGSSRNKGGGVAVVGPEHTGPNGAGGKAYLLAEHKTNTRRRVLWGKEPVTLSKFAVKIRNFMNQAFDETKSQQLSAMSAKLRKVMEDIWKRG